MAIAAFYGIYAVFAFVRWIAKGEPLISAAAPENR
jgi:hypothetical protein